VLAARLQSDAWGAVTDATFAAGLDWRVLTYTFGITLASIFLFGLAPALKATRVDLSDAFQDGSPTASDSARMRATRGLLIVAEVALTVVVLAGAGLLIRSFVELQQVRRGYDARDLLTMRIPVPQRADVTPQSRALFLSSVLEDVRGLPGVRSAAVVTGLPLGGLNASVTLGIEGHSQQARSDQARADQGPDDMPWANVNTISPDYFETLGTRVLRGRAFAPTDTLTSMKVAIVNQALVREQAPTMYLAHAQRTSLAAAANFLVIRTAIDPLRLDEPVMQAIRRHDSGQVIRDVRTMEQVVARSISQERALMLLMAVFGAIALLLACAGVYGANQYVVVQRTRELGIRMSLGARRMEILALVIRQGMAPVAIGITLGLAAAMIASRAVTTFLYGISPLDPFTFVAVGLIAIGVALASLGLPAWRATSIDPLIALRHE
jgi:putative ABC transport system permease protein